MSRKVRECVTRASDQHCSCRECVISARQGAWSRRIRRQHPDLAVDCWVRTGSLDRDMARCLKMYEAQGGTLKPSAAEYLDDFLEHGDDGEEMLKQRVHPSEYDHPCEWFFGADSTQRASINEVDEPVCALIEGGCDCCGSLPYPPIADGLEWPDDGFDVRTANQADWKFWHF